MNGLKCRGYAGGVPVYCAHDKIVPVGEMKPNPKNPNQHPKEQIELLAKIIKTQGWRAPITVSTLSGLVVRGHGRLMAAMLLGLDSVPVDFQNYSCYDAELADLLADNKIAELAEIDNEMLAEVFQDIDPTAIDIDITGYSEEEYNDIISALMDATAPEPGELDPDEAVEVQETTISRLGDVWLLGKHRLMCGDSTHKETVGKLLNGKKASMVFTDPPYGYEYQSNFRKKTAKFDVIENDDKILDFMPSAKMFCSGFVFICTTWKTLHKWLPLFNEYFELTNMVVWHKPGGGLGDLEHTFSTDYELILVAHNGATITGKRLGCVWTVGRDSVNKYSHPTQKPVGLSTLAIENTTVRNDIVLDLFGGSGSTLVACEQLHRTCYMMELDPRYVDVIVKRYIGVTGKTDVTLLREGERIPVEKTGILEK